MADLAKMTATQRRSHHDMADLLRRFEWDIHHRVEATERIPLEWHEIARERHPQRKQKVTLALEEDVVRFFNDGHGPWRADERGVAGVHAWPDRGGDPGTGDDGL